MQNSFDHAGFTRLCRRLLIICKIMHVTRSQVAVAECVWLWCERIQVQTTLQTVAFIATAAAIYTLGHRLHTFTAVPNLTQPSTLHGTVKWVSAYTGWVILTMATVGVDGSSQFSADSQPKLIGLVWGLAATRRSVYIHQMNLVNSRNDFVHYDSTVSIVVVIIVIIIIITA